MKDMKVVNSLIIVFEKSSVIVSWGHHCKLFYTSHDRIKNTSLTEIYMELWYCMFLRNKKILVCAVRALLVFRIEDNGWVTHDSGNLVVTARALSHVLTQIKSRYIRYGFINKKIEGVRTKYPMPKYRMWQNIYLVHLARHLGPWPCHSDPWDLIWNYRNRTWD